MDLINLSLSKQKNNTGRTTIKNHAQFVVKTTSNTTYIQRKRRILIEKMRAPTTTTDPDWSPQLDRYLRQLIERGALPGTAVVTQAQRIAL